MVTVRTQASTVFRPCASQTRFLTGSCGKLNRAVCLKSVASTSPSSFKVIAKRGEWSPSMPSPAYLNGRTVLPFVSLSPVLRHQRLRSQADKSVESEVSDPSVGKLFLFVIVGLIALAKVCRAMPFIVTVGVFGVASCFAVKNILGDVLSGLHMQFWEPFSVGETIKVGSIEGKVMKMGPLHTILLNSEKGQYFVPNSRFFNQVIVYESRTQCHPVVTEISLQFEDLDKVWQISDDIRKMLRLSSKVFLGMEAPYCSLSGIDGSYAELTLGCNLRPMSKNELYSTHQDILLQSVEIINRHGATLGKCIQRYSW